jgi:hypothetical protein
MEFLNGLKDIYGSHDKGVLAIAAILTPEALLAASQSAEESVDLGKPELIDSLKGVIQNVETGVIQAAPPVIQGKARAESVAQRKEREAREHAETLAESDEVARLMGRNDIEYDLDNVRHRVTGVQPRVKATVEHHYEVEQRKVRPLTRPCGHLDSKKRHAE